MRVRNLASQPRLTTSTALLAGGPFPVFVEMRALKDTPRGQPVYAPDMGFMHTRLRIGEFILDPACYPDKRLWVAIQRTPDVLEVTGGDIAAGASCVPPFQVSGL